VFKYIVSKIKICNGEIERSTMLQLNDSVVENFLQDYENEIIIFLNIFLIQKEHFLWVTH